MSQLPAPAVARANQCSGKLNEPSNSSLHRTRTGALLYSKSYTFPLAGSRR
jgi:hypothetical protein